MNARSRPRARSSNDRLAPSPVSPPARLAADADMLRFACGHVEPHASALSRARQNSRVAWIPCALCNVITVAGFARKSRASGKRKGG